MTIANEVVVTSAAGGVTNYSFPFRILADTDIKVSIESAIGIITPSVLTTDYTVTFVSGVEGGTVVFNLATTAGTTVWLESNIPDTQAIDYEKNKAIPSDSVETAQDKLTSLIQQVQQIVTRCLKVDINQELDNPSLPAPSAGDVLVWNSTEDGLINATLSSPEGSFEYTGVGSIAGTTLATLTLPDNSGVYIQAFATGLIGASQEVFTLEAMLSRTTGATTVTEINSIGGLAGGYITAEPSGNDIIIVAYSPSAWACEAVLTSKPFGTITST